REDSRFFNRSFSAFSVSSVPLWCNLLCCVQQFCMNTNEAYTELVRNVREQALLGSCGSLLGWDERTYMPRAGVAHRGEQMALIARLCHQMMTAPLIGELLGLVGELDGEEAANVREIRRVHDRAVKIPQALVEELARVTTQAQSAWEKARSASDYGVFRPWLEK